MNRRGLPPQEEQSPDSSLQEQQSSRHQQRRSRNLENPSWQDGAQSLSLQEQSLQQQQRSLPFREDRMQSVPSRQYFQQNIHYTRPEIHLQQYGGYSDQQSIQASNQSSRMEQQRHHKSQKSAIQSHPQQQHQLRAQQYQRNNDQQQRSWNQSVQASNQRSHAKSQRYQNKSQQSATQSYPQQRRAENLPQPWQDKAQSLSLQKHSSQQQQQLKQTSFQQHPGNQQRKSWDQSVHSYTKPQHYQNKSQQSVTQSHPQHQMSQKLPQQQQLSSVQPSEKNQQQQQITPDTLAALSQLTLKGTRELDMASSTMKDCQARIPKRQRKQPSSETAFITVKTNMFKITFKNNFLKKAVHYDVDIIELKENQPHQQHQTTSNRFSKALCRKIFKKCREKHFKNRFPAFDGRKNAYTAYDLPFKSNIFENIVEMLTCKCPAECNRHLRKFKVILKKVAEIDLSWTRNLPSSLDEVDGYQTGIQALDIIMRHEPESRHINIGRSFFWPDNNNWQYENFDLGGGLYAERGGFLSVILGQQMYLNVDVAHKAFVMPQKVDALYKSRYDYYTINKLLKDLKVTYKILKPKHERSHRSYPSYRSYRLDGIGQKLAEQKFIYREENGQSEREISVTDYFFDRYEYHLEKSSWPCLVVKGQQTYLPPELCTIESGQSVKKLNDEQTSKMIKIAAITAPSREKEIVKTVFNKLVDNNSEIMAREFQLSVKKEMETVNARILNTPNIIYADREVNVSKGTWQMQKFKQPINLEENRWTILCIRDKKDEDILEKHITINERMKLFMDKLKYHAGNVGMRVDNTKNFKCEEKPRLDIKKYFQENKKFKLIIVIIPNSPGTIYNEIKQIAELELGILTQCIKFSNFNNVFNEYFEKKPKGSNERAIIRNILLKINTKLNGINHALDPRPKCFEKICMFVGADVTHPSYDEGKPSIAAVTASNDIDGLQYNVIHKVLPSKQEIIMDLKNIIDVQLSIYKDKTSRLPERIIYYRDGVSEGQLPQVMHYEIEAIRDAYKNKCKCDIEITCLIVQKRHHVRLFPPPNSQKNFDNKKNWNVNVNVGTIVDSQITHPSHFDFYLVSHASIQGTARPTKYKCICNDSNFTENEIEELTYYLCHMYARCTRTVSYPVPTYYAHLAAYRGKVLLHGYSDNDDRLREIQERFNTKMANLPMYFV